MPSIASVDNERWNLAVDGNEPLMSPTKSPTPNAIGYSQFNRETMRDDYRHQQCQPTLPLNATDKSISAQLARSGRDRRQLRQLSRPAAKY